MFTKQINNIEFHHLFQMSAVKLRLFRAIDVIVQKLRAIQPINRFRQKRNYFFSFLAIFNINFFFEPGVMTSQSVS